VISDLTEIELVWVSDTSRWSSQWNLILENTSTQRAIKSLRNSPFRRLLSFLFLESNSIWCHSAPLELRTVFLWYGYTRRCPRCWYRERCRGVQEKVKAVGTVCYLTTLSFLFFFFNKRKLYVCSLGGKWMNEYRTCIESHWPKDLNIFTQNLIVTEILTAY